MYISIMGLIILTPGPRSVLDEFQITCGQRSNVIFSLISVAIPRREKNTKVMQSILLNMNVRRSRR